MLRPGRRARQATFARRCTCAVVLLTTFAASAQGPKGDGPKTDATKTDATKADATRADATKADATKSDTPKDAAPKSDAAKARAQYDAAAQAYAKKRYVEAALLFEAAAELQPHGATLYMAARAWEQADHPDRAADAYARAQREPGLAGPQAAYAKERLSVLEASLGALEVTSTEPVRVQVDKQTDAKPPARLHATPGLHTVTVRGDGWMTERKISFEAGATHTLALTEADRLEATKAAKPPEPPPEPKPQPPVAAAPPSAPRKSGPQALKVVGWASAGTGVALLGAAGVLWWQAGQTHNEYLADPTAELRDRGATLVTLTNVALAAGAALAATGAVLVLWPSGGSNGGGAAQVVVTPTGAMAVGVF